MNCLSYMKGLSVSMQARSKDICQACSEIEAVKSALRNVRAQIDTYHTKWYAELYIWVMQLMHLLPPSLVFCGRQRHRSNVPAETPEVYYR